MNFGCGHEFRLWARAPAVVGTRPGQGKLSATSRRNVGEQLADTRRALGEFLAAGGVLVLWTSVLSVLLDPLFEAI